MSCKVDTTSNDINDWRYTNQLTYLNNVNLKYSKFMKTKHNDHEHCRFCWDKFLELDGYLHYGYHTLDGQHWICPKCYNDFKHMFNWIIVD